LEAGPTGRPAAEDAAGEADCRIRKLAADRKGHRPAEIERDRKYQQERADRQLEVPGIAMRDQQRSKWRAKQATDHEWPNQREIEIAPH
jgi:hypothetical protein